jgi:hypothetical protein
MNLFNLLQLPDPFLTWMLVLLICLLVMLGSFGFYLFDLARARVSRQRFLLLALVLLAVGGWGIKVGFDAYQIYFNYQRVVENAAPTSPGLVYDFFSPYPFFLSFSAPYVLQLYSLLFLAIAGIVLLLCSVLRIRLELARFQAQSVPGQQESSDTEISVESLPEEYNEPEGYIVEVVSIKSSKAIP